MFKISQDLIDECISASFVENEEELIQAAHLSAVCTHPWGNRRYNDLVFQVDDGVVTDVQLYADR